MLFNHIWEAHFFLCDVYVSTSGGRAGKTVFNSSSQSVTFQGKDKVVCLLKTKLNCARSYPDCLQHLVKVASIENEFCEILYRVSAFCDVRGQVPTVKLDRLKHFSFCNFVQIRNIYTITKHKKPRAIHAKSCQSQRTVVL